MDAEETRSRFRSFSFEDLEEEFARLQAKQAALVVDRVQLTTEYSNGVENRAAYFTLLKEEAETKGLLMIITPIIKARRQARSKEKQVEAEKRKRESQLNTTYQQWLNSFYGRALKQLTRYPIGDWVVESLDIAFETMRNDPVISQEDKLRIETVYKKLVKKFSED